MTGVAAQVLTAPHAVAVFAHQLAAMIADPKSATEFNAHVFAFFAEVSVPIQKRFNAEMGVNEAEAKNVAALFSRLSGYKLALAE
jgi:hypothetical protein